MGSRPIIGIIACGREVEGEPAQAVKHRYIEAVTRYAGAAAVLLPGNQPIANAMALMQRLDAVLLTGSNSNIAPGRYGSNAIGQFPQDTARDDFATAMIHAAIAARRPLFGVCRGLQEINVALGGTLADTRIAGPYEVAHHASDEAGLDAMFGHGHGIDVVQGTPLSALAGTATLQVNSVHYQRIDQLAPGLIVNARSPDGVIEAISATGTAAPVFAVQWHPEWHPDDRPHDLAFWQNLAEAARTAYAPLTQPETSP